MSDNIKLIICIISVLLCSLTMQATKLHPAIKANMRELLKLDSIISVQNELSDRKELRIESIKTTFNGADEPGEKLLLAKRLFEEYIYYDTDSALKYSRIMHNLGQKVYPENDSLFATTLIDQAFIYSIQGFHSKANDLLNMIPPQKIRNDEVRLKFFKAKEYGASMELVYATDNKENTDHIYQKILQYRDSLSSVYGRIPDRFPWIPIANKLDGGKSDEIDPDVLEKLKLSVDTVTNLANIDAPSAFWLARYYKAAGDSIKMIHYLTKASQIKILNQFRENPALPELAELLFAYGDLDRAFNYIVFSANQVNAYKNRNRMVNLTSIVSDVKDAYNEKLKQRDRMLHLYMTGIIIFAVILVCFIIALINRNKKLHAIRDRLAVVNSELMEALRERDGAISSLKTANSKLEQLNKMKHEVIALAFHLAAIQIGRLNEFRKKLLRKFKTNQFADMGPVLNDDEIVKEYYADLNKAFDKTVISTFPEFIDDYNKSCGEGNKVDAEAIKKTQALNIRLRIYALRRLGIEKSADLAQILNISIRTVYNNRSTDPKIY